MSWILSAVGGGVSAAATLRGARAESQGLGFQADATGQQANADEAATRRAGRAMLGTQAAAMAQAGGGVDEGVIRQSAVNSELDALNIRYGGLIKSYGLRREASQIKSQSKLLAGAQLLSSGSASYGQFKAAH